MPTDPRPRIIEETLSRKGGVATYDEYEAVALEIFPDEMEAFIRGFARTGFIKWLKDGMRRAANIDESDPFAPEVQLDLLPGLPARAYLDIGSTSEPRLIRYLDATVADLERFNSKRRTARNRITARMEDEEQKILWLKAHARHPGETVREVLARMGEPEIA